MQGMYIFSQAASSVQAQEWQQKMSRLWDKQPQPDPRTPMEYREDEEQKSLERYRISTANGGLT